MSSEVDIFADALELDRSERATFLDRACQGDGALRARIEALLTGHDKAVQFLHETAAPARALRSEEEPGAVIGRYTLREKIGEGGCGAVWVAAQGEPVKRRVALKVIKLGMDTREVVARFEAERQALALMDHPNIAKVFDAGATATGRPFFVMELVRGVPITRYCDEHLLAPAQRIELVIGVCHAVQHAHEKGIIHRDLKPSNILVMATDGVAAPKVIDFGIAKATQGRLGDHTVYTSFQQIIGTPAYMSPEQIDHSGVEVDPRSDIYALGVLLYELLTGAPPFGGQADAPVGPDELRAQIRTVEPPRPSTRLRTLASDTRKTVARVRGTPPARLAGLLRGDLDWIVMRCLEKEPARRYESAHALALDLQRCLRHEPITARPPGALYVLGKFERRHRVELAAVGAVAAGLAVAVGLWPGARERATVAGAAAPVTVAKASAPSATTAPMTEARQLALQADAFFQREDPSRTKAEFAESLCKRAVALDPHDAEIRAIYSRVHVFFYQMGFDRSPQRAAAARQEAELAVNLAPASFEAQLALANFYRSQPATREEGLKRLRELAARRPEHRLAQRYLCMALIQWGKMPEALPLLERACAVPGGDPLAQWHRGMTLHRLGRYEEAESAIDQSLALHPSDEVFAAKTRLALFRDDLPAAMAALERLPSRLLVDPEYAAMAALARLWNGELLRALETWRTIDLTYLRSGIFSGPREYVTGLALVRANRPEAARAAWEAAWREVEARLGVEPNSKQLLGWKGVLLARLGDDASARQAILTYGQMTSSESGDGHLFLRVLAAELRAGNRDKAVDQLRQNLRSSYSRVFIRYDPEFDDLRDEPWFREEWEKAEAAKSAP